VDENVSSSSGAINCLALSSVAAADSRFDFSVGCLVMMPVQPLCCMYCDSSVLRCSKHHVANFPRETRALAIPLPRRGLGEIRVLGPLFVFRNKSLLASIEAPPVV